MEEKEITPIYEHEPIYEHKPIYEHENYGPLIDSYSRSIFKSALLLDEDIEVFLREYSFKSVPEPKKYLPSYGLTASIASIVFSLFISRRYCTILYTIPSVALTAKFAYLEFRTIEKQKNQAKLMNDLIETIRANHFLNGSIVRYMKARVELGRKSDQLFFTPFSRSTQEFMKILSKCEYNFFQTAMENLSRIASFSSELMEDYKFLKRFNSVSMLKDCEVGDIYECLKFSKMVQDVHIWITSKLLSYIGIIFCSKSSTLDEENFELFINVRIPHILMCLKHHHAYLKEQFAFLRDSVKKLTQYKKENTVTTVKNVSMKLRDTLIYSINNISVILEKSQGILEKIEQGQNHHHAIDKGLLDLRDHTQATYESLDLLCRLYGIMSSKNHKIEQPLIIPQDNQVAKTYGIINCDDEDMEVLEEQYELYLDDNKDAIKQTINKPIERRDEDESAAYLGLMLDELKQSLKKHERFIEAKKRRGSVDVEGNDGVVEGKVERKPESPPKFNLDVLKENQQEKHKKIQIENKSENGYTNNAVIINGNQSDDKEMLMPAPPPLPNFNLNDLQTDEHFNNKTMLENVITLSKQRHNEEEVFVISESDSD